MKKKSASKTIKKAKRPVDVLEADSLSEAALNQDIDKELSKEGAFLPAVQKHPLPPSIPTDDPLALYLRQIHKIPLLKLSEEQELARKAYDEKDPASIRRLIQSNLRFVVKISFEYARFGHKILDLIQEGNIGLIQAVHHFNPYKEVRLTTYAVWWIRSYIRDYLLKNWSIVRIGTTAAQKKLFYRLKKEQEKWERLGINPQVKAIAHNLGVREDEVETMQQRMSGRDSSLSPRPDKDGDDTLSFENTLASENSLPSAELEEREDSWLIHKALEEFQDELNDREKDFVKRRLLSETPVTLEEFGKDYGISKERSRQIEEQIKKKLKEYLSKYYPEITLD
ncbi:MAG: RNA polymerase factor sigma-32 [Bdellovibrionota bacterium]